MKKILIFFTLTSLLLGNDNTNIDWMTVAPYLGEVKMALERYEKHIDEIPELSPDEKKFVIKSKNEIKNLLGKSIDYEEPLREEYSKEYSARSRKLKNNRLYVFYTLKYELGPEVLKLKAEIDEFHNAEDIPNLAISLVKLNKHLIKESYEYKKLMEVGGLAVRLFGTSSEEAPEFSFIEMNAVDRVCGVAIKLHILTEVSDAIIPLLEFLALENTKS